MFKQIIEALTREEKYALYAKEIHPQTISNWKNGKRKPTYAQCIALSEVTGESLEKLLVEVALMDATEEQQKKFAHLLQK